MTEVAARRSPDAARDGRLARASRCLTLFGGAYFLWTWWSLNRQTRAIRIFWEDLGADLPAAQVFLMTHGLWIYPVLFGSAVLGILISEVVHGVSTRGVITRLTLFLAVVIASDIIQAIFCSPFVRIAESLY